MNAVSVRSHTCSIWRCSAESGRPRLSYSFAKITRSSSLSCLRAKETYSDVQEILKTAVCFHKYHITQGSTKEDWHLGACQTSVNNSTSELHEGLDLGKPGSPKSGQYSPANQAHAEPQENQRCETCKRTHVYHFVGNLLALDVSR